MKHSLTSLSLLGLTLLATTGYAADAAVPPVGTNDVATTDAAGVESTSFDDVLFAPYPELVGAELLEALRTGRLAQTVATTLNSDGDELRLHLNGELFVPTPVPGLSVGGSVDQEVTLARKTLADGTTVYELSGERSMFAAANGSVGIASAALGSGRAASVMWRFASQAELVLAVHGLVYQSALGQRVGIKASDLTKQLVAIDAALAPMRALRAYFSGWLAPYLPTWVNDRIATLANARLRASRALSQLNDMARQLEALNVTLARRPTYVTIELDTQAAATLGATLVEAGGDSAGVIGAGWEGELTPSVSVIAEVRDGLPRRADIELRLTRETRLRGGVLASLDANLELELLITGSASFTNGLRLESVSDRVELSVDRSFAPGHFHLLGAQYAAGRRTTAVVDLSELCSVGILGIEALVAQDAFMAAGLLSQLPITLEGQARIERAGYAGLKLDLGEKYFAFGLNASAWWTDAGDTFTMDRPPTPGELLHFYADEVPAERAQETIDTLLAVAVELGQEP